MKAISYSLLLTLAMTTAANAAGSMLRVTCEGDDIGAEVLVNGQFKGECPMDLQVPAGNSKLRLQKQVNKQDRIFEQDIRIGDGGVKKVEAHLVGKVFLTRLKEAEAGKIFAMRWLSYAYKVGSGGVPKDSIQAFSWDRKAADAGDLDAMFSVGNSYRIGAGVDQDEEQAKAWFKRALEIGFQEAENGTLSAMISIGTAYALGLGVPADKVQAKKWLLQAKAKGYVQADAYIEMYELR